jgi:OOP family OmpA-OmpF porin
MRKLLLASILLTSSLLASERPYEFGVNIGATSIENEDSIKLENPTFGLSLQSNYTKVKPRLDIEYTSLDDLDNLFKRSDDKRRYVDSLLRASINGIYEFNDDNTHRLLPYLLAGAGYERVGHGADKLDSNPFIQLGGGLKYLISSGVSTKLEVKALQIVGGDKVEKNEMIALLGLAFPFGTFSEPKPDIEDSDGDGVMDQLDKCPNTPKGTKVDGSGCPLPEMVNKTIVKQVIEPVPMSFDNEECPVKTDLPDRDRDGVEDSIDQCPNTPCDFSVDKNGCPLKAILRIHFDTAKWSIKPESLPKVKKFAEFLLKNKGSLVTIEGHTDSRGSDNYNMVLSKKRAESVRSKLIELGVSAARITAVGKGEKEPIATNKTKEGMAKNRRIEVHLTYPTELKRGRK